MGLTIGTVESMASSSSTCVFMWDKDAFSSFMYSAPHNIIAWINKRTLDVCRARTSQHFYENHHHTRCGTCTLQKCTFFCQDKRDLAWTAFRSHRKRGKWMHANIIHLDWMSNVIFPEWSHGMLLLAYQFSFRDLAWITCPVHDRSDTLEYCSRKKHWWSDKLSTQLSGLAIQCQWREREGVLLGLLREKRFLTHTSWTLF